MLNNTKLRHFWAQIVSWAPRHARKTFIVLAPGIIYKSYSKQPILGLMQVSVYFWVRTPRRTMPFPPSGLFYFPPHKHQIEGTNGSPETHWQSGETELSKFRSGSTWIRTQDHRSPVLLRYILHRCVYWTRSFSRKCINQWHCASTWRLASLCWRKWRMLRF